VAMKLIAFWDVVLINGMIEDCAVSIMKTNLSLRLYCAKIFLHKEGINWNSELLPISYVFAARTAARLRTTFYVTMSFSPL
jgi:hypothetical protein